MQRRTFHGPPHTDGQPVPAWVHGIGTAVWISGPDRRIEYINRRAEGLLGIAPFEALGARCYRLIAGKGPSRSRFCGPDCPVLQLARRGLPIPPFDLSVTQRSGNTARMHVLVIPAELPGNEGRSLIHCAFDRGRSHRIEHYLSSLASRAEPTSPDSDSEPPNGLTEREHEILRRLARDESLRSIARTLDVSYCTVRNHVQHVLHKLGAHSMKQAIALYLLTGDSTRVAPRRDEDGETR